MCQIAKELTASQEGLYSMQLSGHSVSQLAVYQEVFSFFSLYLRKKSYSCVHTSQNILSEFGIRTKLVQIIKNV